MLIARQLTGGKDWTMARTTSMPNDQALAAIIAAKTEIDRLLTDLTALSADHFNASPDAITWGHVGTANHIRERAGDR